MEDLTIAIEGLNLETVIGTQYPDSPLTLADAIVVAAAKELLTGADVLSVSTRIRQIRDEEIRAQVAAEIQVALAEPFHRTNYYGEGRDQPITLRTLIADEAKKFFTEQRRPHGRYDGPTSTAAQDVVAALVKDALTKELAAAVADEKAKVVAAVRAKAAELIATAVKEGVGR